MNTIIQTELAALNDFVSTSGRLKVGLLYGPKSYEDATYISSMPFELLATGYVNRIAASIGLDFSPILNTKANLVESIKSCDAIFVNMHGEYGEDGCIQGLLTFLGLPYTGSGIFTSALCSDKVRFKKFAKNLGIICPPSVALSGHDCLSLQSAFLSLGDSIVVKPVNGGSSIGQHIIASIDECPDVADMIEKSQHSELEYFAEQLIRGVDITVSILELPNTLVVLPILEISALHGYYDERSKIATQKGEHVIDYFCPARFDKQLSRHIADIAISIFVESGCKGFARIDFVVDSNEIYCLEVNTIPGLQEKSNFFRCSAQASIPDDAVIASLLYNGIVDHKQPTPCHKKEVIIL